MSLNLQIDNYAVIQDCLDDLKLFLRTDYFTSRSIVDIYSPLWTVYSSFNKNKLAPAEWGMTPNWDRKKQIPKPLTIARAETLHERVSYKSLMRRYRALVPVNAVRCQSLDKTGNNVYKNYLIKSNNQHALALAALYQFNVDGNMQVVLITQAQKVPALNKTLRLPVIINADDYQPWLTTEKMSIIEFILEKEAIRFLDVSEIKA